LWLEAQPVIDINCTLTRKVNIEGLRNRLGKLSMPNLPRNPIVDSLENQLPPPLSKVAAKWLDENKQVADILLSVTGVPFGSEAARDFLLWLGDRIGSPKTKKSIHGVPASFQHVPIEKAPEVAATLAVAGRVSGAAPGHFVVVGDGKKLEMLAPEYRIGLGTTKVNGVAQPIMLIASDSSPAVAQAQKASSPLQMLVVGHATASLPPKEGASSRLVVSKSEHRPGRSVAHCRYFAGSLGAYVKYQDEETDRLLRGFIGASHVLSNMVDCERGNHIYSPGPPDEQRVARFHYGSLFNWVPLVHYSDQADPDLILNDVDVALVTLKDFMPTAANVVPDPDDPSKLIQVEGVLSPTDVRDHTLDDVFMIGRTTKFSRGRLTATDIEQYPVRMPNRRNYMFKELCLVDSGEPKRPFSQPGDSGAIVYVVKNNKAKALGFVVGGSGPYTFVSLASSCLKAMNASLL
jgi:hypothetical protein